ncbi:MAG TPA: GPP34 family phosphoprotein [Candidatus Sulfopaludibacter sp.]|nr:GPP34 family phosphoprotein [Candidatus Sulfopaludibacter sp.]
MLEEVVLLAVDEKTGNLRSAREFSTAYALVGAVFFDLALARKIDTDTETIHIIDRSPTGNPTLDRVMADMAAKPQLTTVREWIEHLFHQRGDLEGEALAALISQGVLRHEKSKLLWIIDIERFPLVNNLPQQDVRVRLQDTILRDAIPDSRDIMLVSIAEPCGLLGYVLSDAQLQARKQRIHMLCGLETISRKVMAAISSLDATMRQAMSKVV